MSKSKIVTEDSKTERLLAEAASIEYVLAMAGISKPADFVRRMREELQSISDGLSDANSKIDQLRRTAATVPTMSAELKRLQSIEKEYNIDALKEREQNLSHAITELRRENHQLKESQNRSKEAIVRDEVAQYRKELSQAGEREASLRKELNSLKVG